MKRIIYVLFLLLVVFTFVACKEENPKFKVIYLASDGGWISGGAYQEVEKGMSANIVKAIVNDCFHFLGWSDGITTEKRTDENIQSDLTVTALFERDDYHFPKFSLNTNNIQITSKEDYIKCFVTIEDIDNPTNNLTNTLAKIKGRGNSTWGMPKKPYKLKFEEKVNLFGNDKAKTWTLIANYCDQSLSRNYLAYNLANLLEEKKVTTSTKFVELYLNNSYQGVYLICEQVEVNPGRVDISKDYSDVNTGYLVELDYKVYDYDSTSILGKDYFLIDNTPYSIKNPDNEDVSIGKYIQYISNYMGKCLKTLDNDSYEEAYELIEMNSFAINYIIQELFKNVDVKHSSFYLYKDKDGKLCNGPIWDMDITCGNCDYDNLVRYDYLYARYMNTWYNRLLKYPEFRTLVANILVKNYYTIGDYINNTIDKLYESKEYFEKNFTKWNLLGVYTWPNPQEIVNLLTWEEHIEYLRTWLFKSINYMYDCYCTI